MKEAVVALWFLAVGIVLGFAIGGHWQQSASQAVCAQRLETQERCGKCGDRVVECGELVCVPGQGWLKRGGK